MTTPHVEQEPATSRITHQPGDLRFLMTENPKQIHGPCRRGFMWRVSHVEYNAETNISEIVRRPMSVYELAKMPGVLEQLGKFQQNLEAQGRK